MGNLFIDVKSHWTATGNSHVMLRGATDATAIDAPTGVTINAVAGDGTTLSGTIKLASGGTLQIQNRAQ